MFEEAMAENFPKLIKDITKPTDSRSHTNSSSKNTKKEKLYLDTS